MSLGQHDNYLIFEFTKLKDENARLKAEVERLTFDPLTYLDDHGEWMPRHIHLAAVERLEVRSAELVSENARLKAEVESVRQVAQDNKTETEATRIENASLKAEVDRVTSQNGYHYTGLAVSMLRDELAQRSHDNFEIRKAHKASIQMIRDLQAEVERLKAVNTIEQRTIQGLQRTPEWSEIARMTAYCRELEAEVERLRKAGIAMGMCLPDTDEANKAYRDFEAGGRS